MDKYELVNNIGGERVEYILRNGKALNIYGAKKILEKQQIEIKELKEQISKLNYMIVNGVGFEDLRGGQRIDVE